MIPPARWRKIQSLFEAVADFAPEDRAARLATSCGDDAELRHSVESLLESDPGHEPEDLAQIIGIRAPVTGTVQARGIEEARKVYVQGCLKLLERGERLPNRVLLLLADELGWVADDG